MSFARNLAALGAIAALASSAAAQNGNDILATNGGEVVFIFSDPSNGGAAPGSISTADDLDWKIVTGEFMSATGGATVEIDTFETMFVGDSDWLTIPRIHDLALGPHFDVPGSVAGPLVSQVPDFFSTLAVTVLIGFGPSGLPSPCSIVPTLCPTPGCPPPITGFNVDLLFGTGPGSGIVVSSQAGVAGVALTKFLPGGMAFSSAGPGTCGLGDYEFTGAHSTDENQGDGVDNDGDTVPDGANYIGGFQVGGSTPTGPIPDDTGTLSEIEVGYAQNVVENNAADVGYGPEQGGSSNVLSVSSGTASIGVITRDIESVGGLVLSAFTTGRIGIPGGFLLAAFGPEAHLDLNPADPIFTTTFSALGAIPVMGIDTNGDTVPDEGEAVSIQLPLPATVAGISLISQSFVITSFGPIVADGTTSCETHAVN